MAIWDWFKSSRKRMENSGMLDISNFEKVKKDIESELYIIRALSSRADKTLKKDYINSMTTLLDILKDIAILHKKNMQIMLSLENLQEEEFKSAEFASYKSQLIKQKASLLKDFKTSIEKVTDIIPLITHTSLPEAEIASIRDSFFTNLNNLFKAINELLFVTSREIDNYGLSKDYYNHLFAKFNNSLKILKERTTRERVVRELKPAYAH